MRWVPCTAVALACAMTASPIQAQDTTGLPRQEVKDSVTVYLLDPLTVRGRIDDLIGRALTASEGYVGYRDLRLRPIAREGELLETVPGMILTQHSGSGKSNQMFVRGFNLDHGTDFSTRVEGMPINIPSHAHGQGYTDLNFLVPELVDHVEYSLGSYDAEIGDFSSAGGAHVRLRRTLDRPLFVAEMGGNAFQRLVVATPASIGARGSLLVGGELKGYDGPWERPEDLRKRSGMLRYTWQGQTSTLSLLGLAYDNVWNASDQIPLRAVESGLVTRFGQIDPTLGGASSRYSLSGSWTRSTGDVGQLVELYAVRYDLDLFSNFTYLLDDPSEGDQIRQRDRGRWTLGGNALHRMPVALGPGEHSVAIGAQARSDWADVALQRTRERDVVSIVRHDDVAQWNVGMHTTLDSDWSDRFRTSLGLRADIHGFGVTDRVSEVEQSTTDAIVSPKASAAWAIADGSEVYVSGGFGFHSNDARSAVPSGSPSDVTPVPLARSRGAEIGFRATPREGLRSTVAFWGVDLDSELLFVGDAGTTEALGPSRRWGVTVANFHRIGDSWTADLDVSLTRARFRDVLPEEDRIPGAIENVVAAGMAYAPPAPGVFGAVRLRRFGSYPLVEDDSQRAKANQLLNATLGYRWGDVRLSASLLNLLNERHSDIQYYYPSRLGGEPVGGVEDFHFHPAEPRQLRIALSWGS